MSIIRLVFACLFLFACKQDQNVNALVPEIAIVPNLLDFGEQGVLTSEAQTVYISNGGRVALELSLTLAPDSSTTFSFAPESASVPAGESVAIGVTFAPDTFLDFEGTILVQSNDVETPELQVALLGTGVDDPLPDIDVTPTVLDFGEVDVGVEATQYLSIDNTGRADLQLATLTQTGSGAFRLLYDPSNQTVAADNQLPLILTYTPTQDQGDNGILLIPSNDPDESIVSVPLLGNGGGDFEYPEAIIDCPSTSEPPQWVSLDGSASTDPQGNEPLSFEWSILDQPNYSQGELSNTITESTDLFTDVAGDYTVQLVVTNTLDLQSAPVKCTIEAIPADDLHIELTWDTSRADLDLHLLDNDASLFEMPGDCTFCNPNPSWGGSGSDDNPRLDLDDRGGLGPENINLKHPANGTYPIKVHYFDEHGDDVVVATVRIFTYGELTEELSRVMIRNDVWHLGQVNWPEGTVGVTSTANTQATVRACFSP